MITPRLLKNLARFCLVLVAAAIVLALRLDGLGVRGVGAEAGHLIGAYAFGCLSVVSFPSLRRTDIAAVLVLLAAAAELIALRGASFLQPWLWDSLGVAALVAPVWLEQFRRLARDYADFGLGAAVRATEERRWLRAERACAVRPVRILKGGLAAR